MNPIRHSQFRLSVRIAFSALFIVSFVGCSTPSEQKNLSKAERAHLLVEIAGGALKEGDIVGSLQHLAAAEELDSSIPELHHTKGLAYHAKGEQEIAIQEVKKALELAPQYSNANNTLGKLLLDEAKYTEAEPYLKKAAQDPLNREAYKALTNLGILHYRQGQYTEARNLFNQAIKASKIESCIAHYYQGHLELREGHFPEAIANYHQASTRLCSTFAEAHLALAMTYEKSGQVDLARRKYLEIQQQFNSTQYAQQAIDHLKNLP